MHSRRDDDSVQRYTSQRNRLTTLLLQEEKFWKQRSKVYWLRERDQNTKFFHSMASARKRKNTIQHLKNSNNVLVDSHDGMCNTAKDYFSNLFESGNG